MPADGWVYYDGTAGNYATHPDSPALDAITGDIDVQSLVALDDWSNGNDQAHWSKFGGVGARGVLFRMTSVGLLQFSWSHDGTTQNTESSSVSVSQGDGTKQWVRATLDVDNGAGDAEVKFYKGGSAAVPSWVQLGATQLFGSTTSQQPNNVLGYVASREGGASILYGYVYEIRVYEDLTETNLVFNPKFHSLSAAEIAAKSFTESSSNAATVTLVGSAWTALAETAAVATGSASRMGLTGAIRNRGGQPR